MNIADLRKRLETMEGEERKAAESLLHAMGIAFEKPKPKTRSKFTSKLQPYYEITTIRCRTCNHVDIRYFHHTEKQLEGQWFLLATSVGKSGYGLDKTLEQKRKRTGTPFCKHCEERLSEWPKEKLIATHLEMIKLPYRSLKEEQTDAKDSSEG